MTSRKAVSLHNTLVDALELLQDYTSDQLLTPSTYEPLPSLLEQCEALSAEATVTEPIRTIHHLACSGGTLISKGLAVMPNVTLLSEIDPLSTMSIEARGKGFFMPTDPIYSARTAVRPIDNALAEKMFTAAISALYHGLAETGRRLVLRDHAHSQFCTNHDASTRPTLREMLTPAHRVLSVVTVRHPLDSYLSLQKNDWLYFSPFTLEEYSKRYMDFLNRHEAQPIFRYEDFVATPEKILAEICEVLELVYHDGFQELLRIAILSGDSGRKTPEIRARPRYDVADATQKEACESATYKALCETLGYPADTS